jgi:hypothetical protein
MSMTITKAEKEIIDLKLKKYDSYVERRRVNSKRYHDKIKHTPEFLEKRKIYREKNIDVILERGKNNFQKYYHEGDGKSKKKAYYESHKEMYQAKGSYNYYKRKNKLDLFKERLPDRYALLVEIGYLTDPVEADTCTNCGNWVCKILLDKDYCHACVSDH